MEAFNAGTLAGAGSFRCDSCGFAIALHERDPVPSCPECGGESFRRSSLFGETIRRPPRHEVEGPPEWLDEARDALIRDGDYLAFEDEERVRVFPLQDGWTRIGRSLSAHVRFDDPTSIATTAGRASWMTAASMECSATASAWSWPSWRTAMRSPLAASASSS